MLLRAAEAVRRWWLGRAEVAPAPATAATTATTVGSCAWTAVAVPTVAAFDDQRWEECRQADQEFYRIALLVFAGRTRDEITTALELPPERVEATVTALTAA